MAASLLTGCSSLINPAGLIIDTVPVDKPELIVPQVDEYEGRPVIWVTVTPENIQEVWDKLSQDGEAVVLISLTPDGMRSLTLNMADLLKLVQQQQSLILAYQEYYEANE